MLPRSCCSARVCGPAWASLYRQACRSMCGLALWRLGPLCASQSAQHAFSVTRASLPLVVLCEPVHTDILPYGDNVRPRITGQCSSHGTEAHVRRPITIVIAALGLIALMFWLCIGATGKDAVVVSAQLKPEYALISAPYL